jgi:hypothetical protein
MLSFMAGKLKKYDENKNASRSWQKQREAQDAIDVEYEVIDDEKK